MCITKGCLQHRGGGDQGPSHWTDEETEAQPCEAPPREEQRQACPLSGPLTQANRARHLRR